MKAGIVGQPIRRLHILMFCLGLTLTLRSVANAQVNIGVNVAGLAQSSSSVLEPDVSGAAAPGSYAEFVNGAFGVFDKNSGAVLSQSTDVEFWENSGISSSALSDGQSNPRLIYDPNSGRWFATEITNNSSGNSVLLAVSSGSDPSPMQGNWKAVSFPTAPAGASSTPSYGAFPTLGLDANGVYIATDDQSGESPAHSGQSASLFSIPKTDLLAATPKLSNMTAFYGTSSTYTSQGFVFQPVIDFSPQKGSAVVIADSMTDYGVNRFNVTGTTTGSASLSATQTVNLNPYLYPPSARQPDGSGGANASGLLIPDDRYASSAYQVGNLIYSVHTVGLPANASEASYSALQWSVLHVINDGSTELVQQGMICNPKYDYFNPSICANAAGAVVIGYNRSGPSQTDGMITSLVSVGSTSGGTIAFQNPIQLTSTTVTSFHNNASGDSSWGDYSSLSPDPANSSVFWLTQEIPEPSSDSSSSGSTWGTQITEIAVPEPASFTLVALSVTIAQGFCRLRYQGEARFKHALQRTWAVRPVR